MAGMYHRRPNARSAPGANPGWATEAKSVLCVYGTMLTYQPILSMPMTTKRTQPGAAATGGVMNPLTLRKRTKTVRRLH